MKAYRKIGLLIIIIIVVMQFIQPNKNLADGLGDSDISKVYALPEGLHKTLMNKCYDCHSNNTRYPWYTHIQPVGWWMQDHVNEGKRHLNFDIFSSYNARRQYRKFEEINEMVTEGEMPLPSYTVLHRDAILTVKQSEALLNWCEQMRASMRDKYPADSLRKK